MDRQLELIPLSGTVTPVNSGGYHNLSSFGERRAATVRPRAQVNKQVGVVCDDLIGNTSGAGMDGSNMPAPASRQGELFLTE